MVQRKSILRASHKTAPVTARYIAGLALLFAVVLFSVPASAQAVPANCPSGLATADLIDHDFSVSFCELCEIGTVRIEIENPFRNNDDADFSDIVVTENLLASGLTYVPGTTNIARASCRVRE